MLQEFKSLNMWPFLYPLQLNNQLIMYAHKSYVQKINYSFNTHTVNKYINTKTDSQLTIAKIWTGCL